ncbi:MAG TPA: mechanosensitive ion channel family protein [Nitrospirales bacterium]|nr:mechanosensitive ion channel family protein [Nitrospirales bacterium]
MEPLNIILNSLREMGSQALAHLPNVISAIVILALTWLSTKALETLLTRLLSRFGIRESLLELLQKLVYIGIWIVGILIAAIIIFPSLTPGKILTGLGLGSIAIGFAFKDIFENFLAGILILLREPFQLGDVIECEDLEGFVEEITIRDTHIRQTDGQRVVIPNSVLFKNPVIVRTDRDLRRVTIMCGIAYGEDVNAGRDVIRRALEGLDTVNQEKDIQVFAQGFGASSIDFEVTWWTGSRPVDIRKSKDKVVAAVKQSLDSAGIEIPFPYRTLTFKEPLETLITRHRKEQDVPHDT